MVTRGGTMKLCWEATGSRVMCEGSPYKAACVAKPQEAQQEWRRSSVEELRKRAKKHCGKDVSEEVCLLELGWCIKEVIVSYLVCKRCGEKKYHVEENRG